MSIPWALRGLLVTAVLLSGAWGALALWYQVPGAAFRWLASAAWVVFVLVLLVFGGWRRSAPAFALYAAAFAALLLWWSTIMPSNHRDWADDVSRSLTGSVDGQVVTLYNVRNFNWRSDGDYDVRWETRRYGLDHLDGADVILSSWGMPGIVHALVSFGFDDGSHLVFSVEVRRRRNQSFSSIGGFFKYFERTIVAADERDVIRVRTNVRGETDHLFRLQMSKPAMHALFLSYVHQANQLAVKPAFYNTVTSNCVTIVYGMAKQIDPGLPYDYRLLLTAYLPSYLYKIGALDRRYPLSELTAQGDITARARATGPDDDFSRAIRTPPEP
ncbi:DUF4105 domain-containing protein [Dyella nitratireducens]|uniref:Membrane protein n=1 Tax=Dyella nitratireducens TaxID=1849580 RepID=A0ABQ1GT28_9GAMM|nr:DUF4105 domain-containing protein [Dyella nitratireducens]GGA49810.1 membrane protein [Dyella nitratireducens]GLQ42504.1 membrane protein [Dyella nitratireducens]